MLDKLEALKLLKEAAAELYEEELVRTHLYRDREKVAELLIRLQEDRKEQACDE